jgi:DNA-binding winged helix-turn-helix (wHTH) protein
MVILKDESPVLIGQTGPLNGQRWTLDSDKVLGRDPNCDIIINTPDKQVSRNHAQISITENGPLLKDLGSKNGTHLNGSMIHEPANLEDGDVIQLALAQQFIFLSSDATVPLHADGLEMMSVRAGRLRIDIPSRRIWIGEKEVIPPLSVAQYSMLLALYQAEGQVVSRNKLIEIIWGKENLYDVSNQALDALVRRLRDRLSLHDKTHLYIVTVRGHGLRLDNEK